MLDVTMPVMNGIEAVKLLNSINPQVNIIMITSHGEENMVIESIKYGAKGYILKPVTKEKIQENIDRLFSF
jgi:two-component system chemotaxis response regulator CheY